MSKYKKAPQVLTAALLLSIPICIAEAAVASTRTSGDSLGLLRDQSKISAQTRITNQFQFLQGKTLGLSSPSQRIPFISKLTPEEYQKQVAAATTKLNQAKARLTATQQELQTATDAFNNVSAEATKQASKVAELTAALNSKVTNTAAAKQVLYTAQQNLSIKQQQLTAAQQELTELQEQLAADQSDVTADNQTLQTAQQNLLLAQQTLQAAQAAYDNSSIPNPAYVPPSYTTQPTQYQIPDANFQTGAPWIGDGSGQSGQPEVHPGHLHFSYIGTEVYQDILISPRQIANYTFTVGIWNQDQNSIGQGPVPDTYSLRIYFYDANNNLIHQNSVTSNEVHSWRDVILQGDTNTTTEVAKVRIGVYGIDNGFWSGTYGPAANNVRLTLGWITGTTQGSTSTDTMNVDIGEGGQSTYTAPNGGIFVDANLAYVSYNDYNCGALVDASPFLGGNTITLDANNAVWGDTCGGQVKHLVGTITYSASQPQFIKDPSLLQGIQDATAAVSAATLTLQTAQANLNASNQNVSNTQVDVDDQEELVTEAEQEVADQQAEVALATSNLNAANTAEQSASTSLSSEQTTLTSLNAAVSAASTRVSAASASVTTAEQAVTTAQAELDAIPQPEPEPEPTPEPTPTPTPEPEPEPQPEPEEPIIIVLPPLDDLTKVDFEEITPTDLTQAQAEEIKQAALETFETATQGSPEYEAALTALLVAAQADDIVVDEALAEAPVIGAAVVAIADAINLLSNVGADISPQVRETAQEATVAAVIVGQVAQAAMAATASASTVGRTGK